MHSANEVPPEKEPEPPLKGECTLTLYEEYGFRNFVASYGNGKFHTRRPASAEQAETCIYTPFLRTE